MSPWQLDYERTQLLYLRAQQVMFLGPLANIRHIPNEPWRNCFQGLWKVRLWQMGPYRSPAWTFPPKPTGAWCWLNGGFLFLFISRTLTYKHSPTETAGYVLHSFLFQKILFLKNFFMFISETERDRA